MNDRMPAFWFYANDFLGSTAEMDLECVGAYIRLLCYQWINGGIPKDKAKIARLLHCDRDAIDRVWDEVRSKFVDQGGRLVNKRLEIIREETIAFRENRSMAGKKGNELRWHSDRKAIAKPSPSSSSSSSSSSSKEKKKNVVGQPQPRNFQKPTPEAIREYCIERKNFVDPNKFFNYYEANGWRVGKNPMKDWRAAIRIWERGDNAGNKQNLPPAAPPPPPKPEDAPSPMPDDVKNALRNFKFKGME